MKQSWFYFVANENINTGLLRSQLVEPLESTGLASTVKIINIVHPLTKKAKWSGNGLTLKVGVPARLFQFRLGGIFDLVVPLYYAIVLLFYIPSGSRVVARSYLSALSVYFLSFFKDVSFIFDTRSQYVQENISAGKLKRNSLCHKLWLQIEFLLLSRAEKVIAVSDAQSRYYKDIVPSSNIVVLPCFCKVDYSLFDSEVQSSARRDMGFSDSDVVICYYGSLDFKWNDIRIYSDFFAKCISQGLKICVITPSAEVLRGDARFSTENIFIEQVDNPSAARRLISACDYGVVLMKRADDWESRLSVKFVEYLGSGLQVLVGEWVGEAVAIAGKYFPSSAIVIEEKSSIPPSNLKQIHLGEKMLIAKQADSLFGHHRMAELFRIDSSSYNE